MVAEQGQTPINWNVEADDNLFIAVDIGRLSVLAFAAAKRADHVFNPYWFYDKVKLLHQSLKAAPSLPSDFIKFMSSEMEKAFAGARFHILYGDSHFSETSTVPILSLKVPDLVLTEILQKVRSEVLKNFPKPIFS